MSTARLNRLTVKYMGVTNEDAKNPRYTGSKGSTKGRKPKETRRKEKESGKA